MVRAKRKSSPWLPVTYNHRSHQASLILSRCRLIFTILSHQHPSSPRHTPASARGYGRRLEDACEVCDAFSVISGSVLGFSKSARVPGVAPYYYERTTRRHLINAHRPRHCTLIATVDEESTGRVRGIRAVFSRDRAVCVQGDEVAAWNVTRRVGDFACEDTL
jgi:hypothetical protein